MESTNKCVFIILLLVFFIVCGWIVYACVSKPSGGLLIGSGGIVHKTSVSEFKKSSGN